MPDERIDQLQILIDRIRAGDHAAKEELVARTYNRLTLLTRRILNANFLRLRAMEQTGDFLNEAMFRVVRALNEVEIETVRHYFRLSAWHIRNTLLDKVDYYRCRPLRRLHVGRTDSAEPEDPADFRNNPSRLAEWAEFLEAVAKLSDRERELLDLVHVEGLSQREVGILLGMSQSTVQREWLIVRRKLADRFM